MPADQSEAALRAWVTRRGGASEKEEKPAAPREAAKEAPKSEDKRKWTDAKPSFMGKAKETWEQHFDKHPNEGGKPAKDRVEAVHEPIMREFLDKVKPVPPDEHKVAIFTMGGPASGKSSILKGIDESKFVRVDPDEIKARLPEYRAAIRPDNTFRGAAAMVHEESSHIARELTKRAIDEGKHVIIDGTGASVKSMVDKMDAMRAAGYKIHLMMPHVDADAAHKEMLSRADRTGRLIPETVFRSAHATIPPNFEKIAAKADTAALFDRKTSKAPKLAWEKTPTGEVTHDANFMQAFWKEHGSPERQKQLSLF